jgi:hypothetical protein
MNTQIIILFIIIFILIILFYSFNNKTENYVDNYYSWNWNHPHTIKHINDYVHPKPAIDNNGNLIGLYSLSCTLSDDAFSTCQDGLDRIINNKTNHY